MRSIFDELIEKKSVPQTMLLTGSRETANLDRAKELAKKLLGLQHAFKIERDLHPDLHVYEVEGKNGMHPMASIQKLLEEISLTPFEADYKIFIVDQAERMLPSSSNALLKTLEEPPSDSYLILISNQPDELLATIVSRCRKISLERPLQPATDLFEESVDHMIEYASNQHYDLLLEEITALEQTHFAEDPGSTKWRLQLNLFFETILARCKNLEAPSFAKVAEMIESSYLGIERHIKLRSILLRFFLKNF